jgi:Skp family chaperone for outer membrane proteins
MKYVAALICLLLSTVAAPTYAHEMTNDCADQAKKVTDKSKQGAALEDCLKKVHDTKSDAQELHDKKQHCDTNVANMKLEGKKKTEYLNHCYKENDFDKSNPDPRK